MNKKEHKEFHNKVNKLVGSHIKELRMRRGWSIRSLAKKIGVWPPQLRLYEKGRHSIPIPRLLILCRLFSVPLGTFFQERTYTYPAKQRVIAALFRRLNEYKDPELVTAIIQDLNNTLNKLGD